MKRCPIIGLTGLAGSGKDTVREILVGRHQFIGMALADPIRGMIARLFDSCHISEQYWTHRELKEQVIPGLGVSYRHLAQTLGTEWGRSLRQDFWTNMAQERIKVFAPSIAPHGSMAGIVISDIRFTDEANWVRSMGGMVWRIHRPDVERVRDHASEREVDAITADNIIYNTSTLEHLGQVVGATLLYRGEVVAS